MFYVYTYKDSDGKETAGWTTDKSKVPADATVEVATGIKGDAMMAYKHLK